MRSLDVTDELIGFGKAPGEEWPACRLSREDREAGLLAWTAIVERMKPDQMHMPMSPQEIDRALEILNVIQLAVVTARARNPAHVRPVPEGGR